MNIDVIWHPTNGFITHLYNTLVVVSLCDMGCVVSLFDMGEKLCDVGRVVSLGDMW